VGHDGEILQNQKDLVKRCHITGHLGRADHAGAAVRRPGDQLVNDAARG